MEENGVVMISVRLLGMGWLTERASALSEVQLLFLPGRNSPAWGWCVAEGGAGKRKKRGLKLKCFKGQWRLSDNSSIWCGTHQVPAELVSRSLVEDVQAVGSMMQFGVTAPDLTLQFLYFFGPIRNVITDLKVKASHRMMSSKEKKNGDSWWLNSSALTCFLSKSSISWFLVSSWIFFLRASSVLRLWRFWAFFIYKIKIVIIEEMANTWSALDLRCGFSYIGHREPQVSPEGRRVLHQDVGRRLQVFAVRQPRVIAHMVRLVLTGRRTGARRVEFKGHAFHGKLGGFTFVV